MKTIGKYEILEKIGEGAMGVVYKARDPLMERLVAVKTMSADLDAEPELRERFFREARSAGKLSHKNIITIYELGEEDGKAYMAMEFLDGEDLKRVLARQEKMPLEYKLQLALEVCEGLSHAHREGVIHRDIKPGNIHLTKTGQLKILDFGLARIATSDITKAGSVMGTPSYMSPEQVRGETVDHRSDIFSVGALFYEIFTGRKPFSGTSFHQTFFRVLEKDPEPLDTVEPTIPPELSSIVLRALAKDPEKRYQLVGDLAWDLERFGHQLEKQKGELRKQAQEVVDSLDDLIEANRELLSQAPEEAAESDQTSPMILARLSESEDDADATKRLDFPIGYAELVEIRDRARLEQARVEERIEKLKQAPSLLDEADSLEEKGELERALQLTEKVLRDLPSHTKAAAVADRVREALSRKAQEEERQRELKRLVEEASDLYRRAEFQRSLSSLDKALELDPRHAEASALRQKMEARLEEIRIGEEKARQAEELFSQATSKYGAGDASACLTLVAQVLELQPHHLEATALKWEAEQRIKELAELEEKRRRADQALASARRALEASELEQARREAEQARSLYPGVVGAAEVLQAIERAQLESKAEEERQREIKTLLREARSFERSGNEDQALEQLTKLLALHPKHKAGLELKEKIEERRREREREERERRERIAANFEKARQAEKADQLEQAIELGQRVLAEEADHSGARELVARVEVELEARKERQEIERKAKALLAKAEKLAASEDYHGSVSILEKAEPSVAALTPVSQALQKYRDALRAQEEARERGERIAEHLQRGKKAFAAGEYDASVREMDQILSLASDHAEALDHRGQAQKKIEEERERERERRERIAANFEKARQAEKADQLEQAIELGQRVLAEEADHSGARELVARVEVELEARKERQEIERKAKALLAKAEKLAASEDYHGSVSILEKAEPSVAALTPVSQALQKYRDALRAQEEARERGERIAEHLQRGKKAFAAGEYDASVREMDQILSLASDHAEALDYRGRAQKKIEEQRQRERRARKLAEAVQSAKQALQEDKLDVAAREVQKALALDPSNQEVQRLSSDVQKRQAELREQQQRRERAEELGVQARELLKNEDAEGAQKALIEGLSLWPELGGASKLQKRIEKERARAVRRAAAEAKRREGVPVRPTKLYAALAAVAALAVAAGWLIFRQPGEPRAPTSVEPAPPTEPGPGFDIDIDIARGLASAQALLERHQFAGAAQQAREVLGQSPGNGEAEDILRVAQESLQKIESGNRQAKAFFDAGNFQNAMASVSEVLSVNPSNNEALQLLSQLEALGDTRQVADAAIAELGQAKSDAEGSGAPTLAQGTFEAAGGLEQEATRLYGEKQYGTATTKLFEARDAYRRAEREAKEAQQRIALQAEADQARQAFDQARAKAVEAGAESHAAQRFRQAASLGDQAQFKLGRGDFQGARQDFVTARTAMEQAQKDAVEAAGDQATAAQAAQGQLDAARQTMEQAKQSAPPGGDLQAAAEEAKARQLAGQGNLAEAALTYQRAASLYKAAAERVTVDRQAVLGLIQRYEAAIENGNLDELKSIWPALQGDAEKKYRDAFQFASSWQVDLAVTAIQLAGDSATVSCQRHDEIVPRGGRAIVNDTSVTFRLLKSQDSWFIEGMQE